jgi:hypothetical protein
MFPLVYILPSCLDLEVFWRAEYGHLLLSVLVRNQSVSHCALLWMLCYKLHFTLTTAESTCLLRNSTAHSVSYLL